MYYMYYGQTVISDPTTEDVRAYNGRLDGQQNTFSTFVFTLHSDNPYYDVVRIHDYENLVRVQWANQVLFDGYVEEISTEMNGSRTFSCKSILALLCDTICRPYGTVISIEESKEPQAYFEPGTKNLISYIISNHNKRCLYTGSDGQQHGQEKQFYIGYAGVSDPDAEFDHVCAELDRRANAGEVEGYEVLYVDDSKRTTLEEIQHTLVDRYGAFIYYGRTSDGRNYISIYADKPSAYENDQGVTFGVNMIDFSMTDSALEVYTAVRVTGKDGVTIDSGKGAYPIPADGAVGSGNYKQGDVVYNMAAVEEYGYREFQVTNEDYERPYDLMSYAISQLNLRLQAVRNIQTDAMDMVFYPTGSYYHLMPGDTTTAVNSALGVSEQMLVSACTIDFDNPDATTYTMGNTQDGVTTVYQRQLRGMASAISRRSGGQAVTVIDQQANAISPMSEGASLNTVFEPVDGVGCISARMARSGSLRQVSVAAEALGGAKASGIVGAVADRPVVKCELSGAQGYIDTDGSVVLNGKELGEFTFSAVYMTEG